MNSNWNYSPETLNLGQNRQFFVPCDLEIWQMTSKNNRAPLLCCFKLCVSFHSHHWIQTGVTVRKRPILVKIDDFFSRVTLKFNGWPSKTIGHLFYATSTFVHHFIPIGSVAVNYQMSPSENKETLACRGQRTHQLNGLASIGTPSLVTRCVVQTI